MKMFVLVIVCCCFLAVSSAYSLESGNDVSSDAIAVQLQKVTKKSKRIDLMVELADAFMREGHFDKCLSSCKDVLAEATDKKQKQKIYRIMGDVYSDKKEWSNAIPNYLESITYAPDHEGVRLSLAQAYMQSDLYELAAQEYLKILDINSSSFEANFGIANLYQEEGFGNKAIKYYRAALSEKMDARAYRNVAACYESRGDTDLAIAMLKSAIAIEPIYSDYIDLGRIYSGTKKYKDAEEAFLKAEKIDGKTVDAYLYLGMLYLEKNELELSGEELLKGNDACPGNALIHFFLGDIYKRQNMRGLAAQELRKSADLATSQALRNYSEEFLEFLQKHSK